MTRRDRFDRVHVLWTRLLDASQEIELGFPDNRKEKYAIVTEANFRDVIARFALDYGLSMFTVGGYINVLYGVKALWARHEFQSASALIIIYDPELAEKIEEATYSKEKSLKQMYLAGTFCVINKDFVFPTEPEDLEA